MTTPQPPGSGQAVRRNAVLNIVGEAGWGFHAALISSATVLPLLLRHHGAGPGLTALIAAIDTGLGLLPQLIGPFLFAARRGRKRRVILWHLCPMIPCLFLLALVGLWGVRLPAGWAAPLLLIAWAGFVASMGVVSAVWIDWLASLFHERIRGTVMGLAWGASSALGILGGLIAGWCVERFPAPQVFAGLYVAAAICAIISIGLFAFVRDPADDDAAAPPSPMTVGRLHRRIRQSLLDRNVRAYLVGRTLAWMGFAWVPFVAVHYAAGGLADAIIIKAGAALTLGAAIGCVILGRLGDARGHRLGAIIGVAAQVCALLALLLVPGLPGCLLVFLGAGLSSAGITVSHNNVVLETCPHEDRVSHVVALNLVGGLVGVTVPFAVGPVVAMWGMPTLFAGSLGLSVAGVLWLCFAVREPRETVTVRGAARTTDAS
jgi:MFS family permease